MNARRLVTVCVVLLGMLVQESHADEARRVRCAPDMPSLLNFACEKGWAVPLGVGVEYGGKSDASRNYSAGFEPVYMLHLSTDKLQFFLEGVENGFRYFASDRFLISLAARNEYGRQESDDPEFLRGMGDIADKWMGIAEARFSLVGDYDVWIGGRSMLGDGDTGQLHIAVAGVGVPRQSKYVDFEFMFWSTWADADFLNRDFGVTAEQSARSGYDQFSINSGHRAFGAALFTRVDLTARWKIVSEINFERYNSRLSRSPLVRSGRNSEYELGMNLVYVL